MAQTPSSMKPLRTTMPPFALPDGEGNIWSPRDCAQGTLVIFMCNHCPFVIHVATMLHGLHEFCQANDIEMVGINSNDIDAYPDDSPENMVLTAKQYNWAFPYLFDSDQSVAHSFDATCTPDVFLYNKHDELYYRGQFDDSRPSSGESTGYDITHAIEALVAGKPSPENQKPAIGCNIKWKQ